MSRAGSGIVAESFGENLRRVRRREGLSQKQLAMRASLHRTEVGKLERAGRVCRIDTLIRLARSMAVPPGELLQGIDWVPRPAPSGAFVLGRLLACAGVARERSVTTDETDLQTDQPKRDRAKVTDPQRKAKSAKSEGTRTKRQTKTIGKGKSQ